jgi:HlyD family secretion protein
VSEHNPQQTRQGNAEDEFSSGGGEHGEPRSLLHRLGPLRLIIAAAFVAIAVAIVLISVARNRSVEEGSEGLRVSVRVARAERGSISEEVSAVGTIVPRQMATVSAKTNAQIRHMELLKNRQVHAGDVIASLDSIEIEAQRAEAAAALDEALATQRLLSKGTIPETAAQDEKALRDAQANVVNARAVYQRRLVLFEKGGISKKELDASQLALTTAENELRLAESATRLHQSTTNPGNRELAEARVKQARNRLAALDTQLSYTTVRAPFSGVITEQFQFQGEYATAGGKLFTIADLSEVIVKAPLPDVVAGHVRKGDTAFIIPQAGEERLAGRVSLVSRATDPQSRTVEVWVDLKNESGRLSAAGAARLVVTTRTENDAVIVPVSAVSLDAGNGDEGVVVVVDAESLAHEVRVKVGIRAGDRVQIVSGLGGGETVVVEGNYALPDGAKVEVNTGEPREKSEGERR